MQTKRECQVSPVLLKGIDLIFHGIYQIVQFGKSYVALVNIFCEL